MKKIKIVINYEEEPQIGGEFEKVVNWLSNFPLESEKINTEIEDSFI